MIPEPVSAATAPGPVVRVRVRERGRGEWSFTGQTVEILPYPIVSAFVLLCYTR